MTRVLPLPGPARMRSGPSKLRDGLALGGREIVKKFVLRWLRHCPEFLRV